MIQEETDTAGGKSWHRWVIDKAPRLVFILILYLSQIQPNSKYWDGNAIYWVTDGVIIRNGKQRERPHLLCLQQRQQREQQQRQWLHLLCLQLRPRRSPAPRETLAQPFGLAFPCSPETSIAPGKNKDLLKKQKRPRRCGLSSSKCPIWKSEPLQQSS